MGSNTPLQLFSLPVEHQEIVFYIRYVPNPISGKLGTIKKLSFLQEMVTYQQLKERAQQELGIADIDAFDLCYEYDMPIEHNQVQLGNTREPFIHMQIVEGNRNLNFNNEIMRLQNTQWRHIGPSYSPPTDAPLQELAQILYGPQYTSLQVDIAGSDNFSFNFSTVIVFMYAFWGFAYFADNAVCFLPFEQSAMVTLIYIIGFIIAPSIKKE